jgi:hypothetical protein
MLRSQTLLSLCFNSYFRFFCLFFSESGKVFRLIGMILKYKVKSLFFLPFFLLSWNVQAVDGRSYQVVDILVADQTKSVRKQAFQRGLSEVFVRLSGDESVMGKLPQLDARRYVQRFSYQPLEEIVINSKEEVLTQRIKIHYSANSIEQYLHANGFTGQDDGDDQLRSIVRVAIEAVDSMSKYNRVENYLTHLSVVASVNAMQTEGEKTMFEIVLRGHGDTFLSLIKNDAKLLEVEQDNVEIGSEQTGREQTGSEQMDREQIQISQHHASLKNNWQVKDAVQTIPEVTSSAAPLPAEAVVNATADSVVSQINKTPVYHFRLAN